jgi:hypothetical protein
MKINNINESLSFTATAQRGDFVVTAAVGPSSKREKLMSIVK